GPAAAARLLPRAPEGPAVLLGRGSGGGPRRLGRADRAGLPPRRGRAPRGRGGGQALRLGPGAEGVRRGGAVRWRDRVAPPPPPRYKRGMFEKIIGMIGDKKKRDVAMMAGGMLRLLGGRKIVALGMFAKGALGLEKEWRRAHPEFEGGFAERWERAIDFYESTHQHPWNRKLHIAGIPVIVGGTVGLLLFRPYRPAWLASAGAFTFG